MICSYCLMSDPDTKVIFEDDLVLFMPNEQYQGALKHSGVIIPIQHKETVFDLSEAEIIAAFRLCAVVKKWMDENFAPDGYNIGWNCRMTGGQEVFHAHIHGIPRFRQEALAGKGNRTLWRWHRSQPGEAQWSAT